MLRLILVGIRLGVTEIGLGLWTPRAWVRVKQVRPRLVYALLRVHVCLSSPFIGGTAIFVNHIGPKLCPVCTECFCRESRRLRASRCLYTKQYDCQRLN